MESGEWKKEEMREVGDRRKERGKCEEMEK